MFGLVSDYGDLIAADYGYNRSLLIVMPLRQRRVLKPVSPATR
jgi:hypothetical protein